MSERVILIHVKDRPLKANLPDIDKVELLTLQMASDLYWTSDQKVEYLMEQLENTSIKADEFRRFWQTQYKGTISKKGTYFTRPATIKLIANRL
eukprot:12151580-Karenia_brevis.AAC.1